MFIEFDYLKIKVPYSPTSLCYNMYASPHVILSEKNDIVCYNKIDENKTWLSYKDGSLEKVKNYIVNRFNKKSKYEI